MPQNYIGRNAREGEIMYYKQGLGAESKFNVQSSNKEPRQDRRFYLKQGETGYVYIVARSWQDIIAIPEWSYFKRGSGGARVSADSPTPDPSKSKIAALSMSVKEVKLSKVYLLPVVQNKSFRRRDESVGNFEHMHLAMKKGAFENFEEMIIKEHEQCFGMRLEIKRKSDDKSPGSGDIFKCKGFEPTEFFYRNQEVLQTSIYPYMKSVKKYEQIELTVEQAVTRKFFSGIDMDGLNDTPERVNYFVNFVKSSEGVSISNSDPYGSPYSPGGFGGEGFPGSDMPSGSGFGKSSPAQQEYAPPSSGFGETTPVVNQPQGFGYPMQNPVPQNQQGFNTPPQNFGAPAPQQGFESQGFGGSIVPPMSPQQPQQPQQQAPPQNQGGFNVYDNGSQNNFSGPFASPRAGYAHGGTSIAPPTAPPAAPAFTQTPLVQQAPPSQPWNNGEQFPINEGMFSDTVDAYGQVSEVNQAVATQAPPVAAPPTTSPVTPSAAPIPEELVKAEEEPKKKRKKKSPKKADKSTKADAPAPLSEDDYDNLS